MTRLRVLRHFEKAVFAVTMILIVSPLVAQIPEYTLRASDADGFSGETVTVTVELENLGDDVQGWSYGLCYDSSALGLLSVSLGEDLLMINNGAPPFFFHSETHPNGLQVFVIIDFSMTSLLPPDPEPYEILELEYELIGPDATTATIAFCDSVGTPPTSTEVVVDGIAITPTLDASTILIGGGALDLFVRGDCTTDGNSNIADVVFLLGHLFPNDTNGDGLPDPNVLLCDDACDANDDGSLSIPDAVSLLGALFGLPPTPLPTPVLCDLDPTPDALDCGSFLGC